MYRSASFNYFNETILRLSLTLCEEKKINCVFFFTIVILAQKVIYLESYIKNVTYICMSKYIFLK